LKKGGGVEDHGGEGRDKIVYTLATTGQKKEKVEKTSPLLIKGLPETLRGLIKRRYALISSALSGEKGGLPPLRACKRARRLPKRKRKEKDTFLIGEGGTEHPPSIYTPKRERSTREKVRKGSRSKGGGGITRFLIRGIVGRPVVSGEKRGGVSHAKAANSCRKKRKAHTGLVRAGRSEAYCVDRFCFRKRKRQVRGRGERRDRRGVWFQRRRVSDRLCKKSHEGKKI